MGSVVKLQNDIITNVCTSFYLQDTEIESEIAKAQDQLEKNQSTFTKFKQSNEFSKIRDRADVYIKFCKNRPTTSQVITSSAPNVNKVPVFKPQPELKPQILGKECQLLEFSTWAKKFCSNIKSSPFDLPEGAINDNIRVCMDPSWYVELEERGLDNNTTIGELTTLMQMVAMAKFPIHQRRVDVFECKQKTDSKAFLRELTERVRMVDWKAFDDQAAICHLFMNGCKSEEAKKACYKILTENPAGDTKLLMDKLGEIESFPTDRKREHAKAVKQDETNPTEKICTDCKRKCHLKVDCWGRCAWCGRYGHKTDLCRDKVTETQKQTTKKAQDKKNKKKEKGKKKVLCVDSSA